MTRSLLAAYEARRSRECRLTPGRALMTLDEAADFLTERTLLTRMPDSALPSLFGACHEQPARAGGRGFDLWPRTKWIWSFELTQKHGTVLTKLHRGKSLYLSVAGARVFDPLVRKSIANATGDDAAFLAHLSKHGESRLDDLEVELGWERKRLKQVRDRLQRSGAVVGDGLVFEADSSWFFAPVRRWDQVFPKPTVARRPFHELIVAAMRASVLAPEDDLARWFSWPIPRSVVDDLVVEGRLIRPAPRWLAIAD